MQKRKGLPFSISRPRDSIRQIDPSLQQLIQAIENAFKRKGCLMFTQVRRISIVLSLVAFIMLHGEQVSAETEIQIFLKSNLGKGRYLSAKPDGQAGLADRARLWETITLVDINGESLRSGDLVYLKCTYNSKYYSAEPHTKKVLADRPQAKEWETFKIIKQNGSGIIRNGDKISLLSSHDQYITAEPHTGKVLADQPVVKEWETYVLYTHKGYQALMQFGSSRDPGRFTKVSKNKLISEIRARIKKPFVMRQHSQSLCGPVAILVALAMVDPEQYVQAAQLLYEQGKYSRIKPSSHLYKADVPHGMPHVDWMLAASMRDAENAIFDFDEGDEWAAWTGPLEMKAWMKILLRCRKTEYSSTFLWGEKSALKKAGNAVRAGNVAALLVDADFLPVQGSATVNLPNHWVLLTEVKSIGRNRVEFTIFTWGRKMDLKLSEERFEDLMFGAVIGYL